MHPAERIALPGERGPLSGEVVPARLFPLNRPCRLPRTIVEDSGWVISITEILNAEASPGRAPSPLSSHSTSGREEERPIDTRLGVAGFTRGRLFEIRSGVAGRSSLTRGLPVPSPLHEDAPSRSRQNSEQRFNWNPKASLSRSAGDDDQNKSGQYEEEHSPITARPP